MTKTFTLAAYVFAIALLLGSCTAKRLVPEGKHLYTGYEINLEADEKMPDAKAAKSELKSVVSPDPNLSILGMRPTVWLHLKMGEVEKKKGFRHWLKNKVGEKPVYVEDDVQPNRVAELMVNRLYNRGYFEAQASFEVKENAKTASISYRANVIRPYLINNLNWIKEEDSTLTRDLASLQKGTLFKKGDQYLVSTFSEERARLAEAMKQKGYYYFNANFIQFEVDSSLRSKKVDVYVVISDEMPEEAKRKYRINKVVVNPYFLLGNDSVVLARDTLGPTYPFTFKNYNWDVRPAVFRRSIAIRSDSIYTPDNYERTINRLQGLNVYKYVNVQYMPSHDTLGMYYLNSNINLAPNRKKTFGAEVIFATKSNNFTGPGIRLNWKNRNLMHGAELLEIRLNAGYETIISGQQSGLTSFDLGVNVILNVPRFLLPWEVKLRNTNFVPYTRFKVGYSILNRVFFYQLNSSVFEYGYAWKASKRSEHLFNPVAIEYIELVKVFPEFEDLLNSNNFLKRSFEQQFILGTNYTYTYTDQEDNPNSSHMFLRTMVETSGNTAYGASLLFSQREPDQSDPYRIIGIPFSQYAKAEVDTRYYLKLSKEVMLANRVIVGVGMPYLNSTTLPFIRQFFVGGNNSIRAFQIRSVGPGTYSPEEEDGQRNFFFDQTGDVKLEFNTEFRFPIVSVLKGALFVDAGNVWLLRANEDRPGGEFIASEFMNQLAVGTGFGLRVDVSFLVFRLDLGIPARKPWLPDGEQWVLDDLDFGSSDWRRRNLILNIAIGYPF